MSGKLKTSEVKPSEGGLSKTIKPGNVEAKINAVSLYQPEFLKKDDGYFVVISLETKKPEEGFVGFLIDKNNPDGGHYEGQVGNVKNGLWPYKDGKTKKGVEISRDYEIMRFIKNLCDELGMDAWWAQTDDKYDTIQDMVEDFDKNLPKDLFLDWCIAGREYQKKDSEYKDFDLFLPKFSSDGVPFKGKGKSKKKLLVFDESKHIEKEKQKEVPNFTGEEESETDTATDMSTTSEEVPEFEV